MPMIIQVVAFASGLSIEDAQRVMAERAPQYRALPGLLQKYYVRDPATGELGGISLWDTAESLRVFRASDLARTIASAYRVVGQPRVATFEVLFPLRPEEHAAMRQAAAAPA
jgi:heme-degrading monooxygenase HmoA